MMRSRCLGRTTTLAGVLAVLAMTASISVTVEAQRGRNFDNVQITTTQLDDNLYFLQGQGGQIGVLAGPDGVLMVDTQFAPLTDRIVAAIREISTEPIKFALNTHVHGDHSGGNSNLAAMGVTVMTRDELRAGLASSANPPERLPMVTYDGPVTFHMNGEIARAIPGGGGAYGWRHDGALRECRCSDDGRFLPVRRLSEYCNPEWRNPRRHVVRSGTRDRKLGTRHTHSSRTRPSG